MISPHAVYLNLFDDMIRAKLPFSDFEEGVKEGDTVPVLITHFTNKRVVVKRVLA
jgi:hypothetical protein